MNIAICDDNNDYINTLENYIDDLKVKNLEHDVFYSGEELLNEYKNNEANYDAIFMDMEMGELDGIEYWRSWNYTNKRTMAQTDYTLYK